MNKSKGTRDRGIMVEKFNEAFYESTIFLRISFFSASITLLIFVAGIFAPSWKYLEFTLHFNNLDTSDPSILDTEVPSSFEDSSIHHKDVASDSNMSVLYENWKKEYNFSYFEDTDFAEHSMNTMNLSNSSSELFFSTYDTLELFTAHIVIGLWETRVCTKFLAEENCIPPFKTQGHNWIRRSRGFCVLALGMALLTVVLILMCLFLSIAADMLLTHVMTLLISILSVSSIAVGILIFTTNHTKLDEHTMFNNMGMFQMLVSQVSWACWLSASAIPLAAMTVIFLGLNLVFF
ncbi:uncharacterized protein LOC133191272 [Saccostrea echinata]|uniref:uncharacterized protein LOC133191272 n=1 Tax=Saccostrea echinata TaxID=191078 RepID=UPI002A840F54|nr:uncharacterized protein LOC133191272 [Saccostrea echinata]